MTTQVTIRNDHGCDKTKCVRVFVVDSRTDENDVLQTTYVSEHFLGDGDQVSLYLWKGHTLEIEEYEI